MSGELLGRIFGIDAETVMVFDDHVQVCGASSSASLRYENIRSVKLGKGLITKLTVKDTSGGEISVAMWRKDGLRARRSIETQRRKLKKLREVGFESLEDFEAKAAELGKRLGMS